MDELHAIRTIAHIENDFLEKFGVPRQSGLTEMVSRIVFLPEYRVPEAFRGLEDYSHIWLLWQFSGVHQKDGSWTPTVRPPRLGGNTRMGVFATRSPYRPNAIGLSSVKLLRIDWEDANAPVLLVSGADLMHGTPILDVKPYLPYTDSHPEATSGFALTQREAVLEVQCAEALLERLPEEKRKGLLEILGQDPRPQYHHAPERQYHMRYGAWEVTFQVDGEQLTVLEIAQAESA